MAKKKKVSKQEAERREKQSLLKRLKNLNQQKPDPELIHYIRSLS